MSYYGRLQRHRSPLTILLLSSALSGCDSTLDSIIDCIDNDQPEISGTLPSPILNQYYDEGIDVSIRNEPYDDRFRYSFTFSGDLPQGIQTESADRSFRLIGTPIETGDYQFSISVNVEDKNTFLNSLDDGTEGLCTTYDSAEFQWSVRLM